jgi:hypothetical protein
MTEAHFRHCCQVLNDEPHYLTEAAQRSIALEAIKRLELAERIIAEMRSEVSVESER